MPPARQLAGSPPPTGYLQCRSITLPTVNRVTARIAILSILIADQRVLDLLVAAAAAEAAGVSLPPPPPQPPYHVLEKVSAATVTLHLQWREGAGERKGGPRVAGPAQRTEEAGRLKEVGCRQ